MRLARVLVVFSSVHAYEGFRELHGETGNAQSFIVHIEKANSVQPTEELPIVQRRPPKAASLITVSEIPAAAGGFWTVAGDSFMIISAAEIFDKTFFIIMLLTTTHDKWAVFHAATVALLAHVAICCSTGVLFAKYVSRDIMLRIIVAVYFFYAGLFFFMFWVSDRGKPAEEEAMLEAQEDLNQEDEAAPEDAAEDASKDGWGSWCTGFTVTFSAVFLGEFGDRTQFAMFGQTSIYPVWPVCLGCSAAFLVQVVFSMLAGEALLRMGISRGTLLLFSAISFLGFAIFALVYQTP